MQCRRHRVHGHELRVGELVYQHVRRPFVPGRGCRQLRERGCSPTEYDWTNVPPTPTIDSGPGPTTSPDASFTFSDTDIRSLRRSLDGSAYASCSSGQTYNALDPGLHTFSVKATDGASPTPHLSAAASTQWTISSDNPNVLIAGAGDASFVADNSPYAAEPTTTSPMRLRRGYTVTELATLPADLSSFGQCGGSTAIRRPLGAESAGVSRKAEAACSSLVSGTASGLPSTPPINRW